MGTMTAQVGGQTAQGDIRREGRGFVAIVDGYRTGPPAALQSAAHDLANELRRKLPRADGSWGVSVSCSQGGAGLAFGDLASRGGGGGAPDPCTAGILDRFQAGESNLHRALEAAAEFLAKCCG